MMSTIRHPPRESVYWPRSKYSKDKSVSRKSPKRDVWERPKMAKILDPPVLWRPYWLRQLTWSRWFRRRAVTHHSTGRARRTITSYADRNLQSALGQRRTRLTLSVQSSSPGRVEQELIMGHWSNGSLVRKSIIMFAVKDKIRHHRRRPSRVQDSY